MTDLMTTGTSTPFTGRVRATPCMARDRTAFIQRSTLSR